MSKVDKQIVQMWSFKPDKDIKLTAYDGRTYIQGKEAQTISLTDKDNFDGYTVAQYLSSIIQDRVNLEGVTRIGLNMLNETTPPVTMKGVRANNSSPYDLALKQLKNQWMKILLMMVNYIDII